MSGRSSCWTSSRRENIFTIRDTSLFALGWDTLAFLVWTRRKGIDTVIDLELFSRFTALLTGFAGADHRVGFHRFHKRASIAARC